MTDNLNFTDETIHDFVTYHADHKSRFEETQIALDKLGIKFCKLKIEDTEQTYIYLPTAGPFHLIVPYIDFYTNISQYEIRYRGKNPVMYRLPNGEIKSLQSLFPEGENPLEFDISISLTDRHWHNGSYEHAQNKLKWNLEISSESSWKTLLHEAGHGWQKASKSTVNYSFGGIGNMVIEHLRELYNDTEILNAIKEEKQSEVDAWKRAQDLYNEHFYPSTQILWDPLEDPHALEALATYDSHTYANFILNHAEAGHLENPESYFTSAKSYQEFVKRKILFDQYGKRFQEFNKKILEHNKVKDNSITAGQIWELEMPNPEDSTQTSKWSWSDWEDYQSDFIVINGFDGYNIKIEFTSDPNGSGGREMRITLVSEAPLESGKFPEYKIFVLKPSYDNLSDNFSLEMLDKLMNWYFFYKEA